MTSIFDEQAQRGNMARFVHMQLRYGDRGAACVYLETLQNIIKIEEQDANPTSTSVLFQRHHNSNEDVERHNAS